MLFLSQLSAITYWLWHQLSLPPSLEEAYETLSQIVLNANCLAPAHYFITTSFCNQLIHFQLQLDLSLNSRISYISYYLKKTYVKKGWELRNNFIFKVENTHKTALDFVWGALKTNRKGQKKIKIEKAFPIKFYIWLNFLLSLVWPNNLCFSFSFSFFK